MSELKFASNRLCFNNTCSEMKYALLNLVHVREEICKISRLEDKRCSPCDGEKTL